MNNVLNDDLLQCPLCQMCYEMVDDDGHGTFGAEGITQGEDENKNYFSCKGCYIMENNLIPKLVKVHEGQTKYPKGSMFHYFNTYGNANGMYTEYLKNKEIDNG